MDTNSTKRRKPCTKFEINFLNSNIRTKSLGLKISKFLMKNIFICGFQKIIENVKNIKNYERYENEPKM